VGVVRVNEMAEEPQGEEAGRTPIVLGLLESIERDGTRSQRGIASELGVALGLVNAYLKRCIKKGLIKVGEAPARRYAYYLTPQGFAEKSRLTIEYLSYSFSFFREAKAECARICQAARGREFGTIVLAGKSELAEITTICALETGLQIVAVVDPAAEGTSFLRSPLVKSFDDVGQPFDAVIVTDLTLSARTAQQAIERFGAERVFVPNLPRVHTRARKAMAS
jgi:DNA-binding MarR family transcriptional regulator